MFSKIIGFIMSIIMFICSLLGITGGNKGTEDAVKNTIDYINDGKAFTVTVEENGTTGYQWKQTISDESVVRLAANDYTAPEESGMVGAPGVRVFTYEAVAPGTAEITFSYERSWVSGSASTFTVTLEVAENLTVTVQAE